MAPKWVTQSLADILGLDNETINAVIVPDLEGYTSEVRLRGHLQDFLGPSQAARTFADKYVALRFPAAPTTSSARASGSNSPVKRAPKAGPPPGLGKSEIHDAIHSALRGPVHKKQEEELFPSRTSSGRGGTRSGTQTPRTGTHTPRIGAVTITEKKAKPKKQDDKIWDEPVHPKSAETLRLEGIIASLEGVQSGEGKVVNDSLPCFCQARQHDLSRYTPQCTSCGLILCELQPPHAPCPSCARPTLSPQALARLLLRVESDIQEQLALENEKREQRARERRERALAESGGGAFPSLPANEAPRSAADAARRVLTISNAKGKGKGKAVLTTTKTVKKEKEVHKDEEEEGPEVVPRPRSPPLDAQRSVGELMKTLQWRIAEDRPWGDMKAVKRGEGWNYVEPMVIALPGEEGSGRRSKKKSQKGLGVDGRVVVGAR